MVRILDGPTCGGLTVRAREPRQPEGKNFTGAIFAAEPAPYLAVIAIETVPSPGTVSKIEGPLVIVPPSWRAFSCSGEMDPVALPADGMIPSRGRSRFSARLPSIGPEPAEHVLALYFGLTQPVEILPRYVFGGISHYRLAMQVRDRRRDGDTGCALRHVMMPIALTGWGPRGLRAGRGQTWWPIWGIGFAIAPSSSSLGPQPVPDRDVRGLAETDAKHRRG